MEKLSLHTNFSYDVALAGRTATGVTRSSSSSSSWPCEAVGEDALEVVDVLEVAVVEVAVPETTVGVSLEGPAPEELGVDAGVVLVEAGAELLAELLVSAMHENWSHLALKALRPALWSFSAEWAIVTSLWKRWFAKSWLATNFRYCEYSHNTITKAMMARPRATTGK